MKTVELDGSYGEGGGQILRTALGLSCITGRALKLVNIRKRRKKPGLMPQHLTCVNAAAEISGASVRGHEQGSGVLEFIPGKIMSGEYFFDVKTAGSTSLVLQTVLPPLLFGHGSSRIMIRGGTHVPFSPAYEYIAGVFVPMLNNLGIQVCPEIRKYGFYPKGGGEVVFRIYPPERIKPLTAVLRGELSAADGFSAVAGLPATIAERQRDAVLKCLGVVSPDIRVGDVPSFGKGTFVFLRSVYDGIPSGFTSLGERGKPAGQVGKEAAERFMEFYRSSACIEPHLADQLVVYLSLAKEGSSFTTSCVTQHLITNLWVIEKFLHVRYEIEGETGSEGKINLKPFPLPPRPPSL